MTAIRKLLSDILFIDIETVSTTQQLEDLSPSQQELWHIKARLISKNPDLNRDQLDKLYADKAGIYSEFAKIICISVGIFLMEKDELIFKVKSFYGDSEKEILTEFCSLINRFCENKSMSLCGHNIREFDIPFICRRLLINKMKVPKALNLAGMKPWQVNHILDTMQLWRFGDYKNYTSLNLLASVLGIGSSKEDINGTQVHAVYHKDHDVTRIVRYCENDVFCCAQVYAAIRSIDLPEVIHLIRVDSQVDASA